MMNKQELRALIEKYLDAETTLAEEQKLHQYFREGEISDDLRPYADLFYYGEAMQNDSPDSKFDPFEKINFQQNEQKHPPHKKTISPKKSSPTGFAWTMGAAAGFILLMVGFAAGYYVNAGQKSISTQHAGKQNQQVQQMKAVLMNPQNDHNASAGKRLSAINISQKVSGKNNNLDKQITDILSYTMNNDNSVNVRVAAAEALFKFRRETGIKQTLIQGLSQQPDPLMQITLIDMLVTMKARASIPEMQQLLVNSGTREVVRKRLKVGIARLRT